MCARMYVCVYVCVCTECWMLGYKTRLEISIVKMYTIHHLHAVVNGGKFLWNDPRILVEQVSRKFAYLPWFLSEVLPMFHCLLGNLLTPFRFETLRESIHLLSLLLAVANRGRRKFCCLCWESSVIESYLFKVRNMSEYSLACFVYCR